MQNAQDCCVLWHRRFGHINFKDLNAMRNGAVEGLKYKGQTSPDNLSQVCCEGKQARLPFKTSGNSATELLEIVHDDLCDPMEVMSIRGSRYFLVLGDALDTFKEFKLLIENLFHKEILFC